MSGRARGDEAIIQNLQDLLRQLYEIETIAGDFTQSASQELLLDRLQELQQGLQQFRERAAAFKSIQAPAALCRFVDEGGHPDDFVRQTFKQAVVDSQLAAGRAAAIQTLKEELMAAATTAFPDAAAVYSSVVESKHKQQEAAENAGT